MDYNMYLRRCKWLLLEKVELNCMQAAIAAEELGGKWDHNTICFEKRNHHMCIFFDDNLDVEVHVDGRVRANPLYWHLPEIVEEFEKTGDVSFIQWGATIRRRR